MTLTQGLNVEEGKHTLRLEEFERGNITWNYFCYRQVWRTIKGKPLIILQKMQAAITSSGSEVVGGG